MSSAEITTELFEGLPAHPIQPTRPEERVDFRHVRDSGGSDLTRIPHFGDGKVSHLAGILSRAESFRVAGPG